MPFKSDKQKKYFFTKLNSLPKGSPEYKKWKKVVDKFVAHSVDEEANLLTEKDNREIIVKKLGLPQGVADYAHNISNKYSLWIANSIIKELTKIYGTRPPKALTTEQILELINSERAYRKIIEMFKDDNKPPLDIKNLNLNDAENYYNLYNYIKDWRDNPNTPSINLRNMSWEQAENLSREWHQSLGKGGKVSDILDEYDEIIHKFSDGFYWVFRGTNTCPKSAESMGHCATASEDDMYLFRLIKNDEEFITADYDSINKFIKQLKGKANTKPKEKYYPYIMWLIADSGYINYLRTDEGYEPETNFHLDDLNDEQLKYVISKNPSLFNLNLIMRSSNPEKIFILLYKQLGKKLFVKFRDTIFSNLIERAKNSDEFFDTLYNIGNKEFIEYLSWKNMYDFIKKSKNHDKILNILGDDKVKEFIMNASFNLVHDMYDSIKNYTKDLKKYKDMILDRIKNEYHPEDLKSTTPMNEIFKSLTSLQEELNEQKLKQKNLEKVKQFLFERKGFLDEDFKSQEQNYIKQGNDPQIVKTYIERFRKIRDKNYKQLNDQIGGLENVRDRKNIDSYKTFKELETIVDYVMGQVDLTGASLGKDIEIDAKPIYEDDVFQIYYADSPRACIKYKGNVPYSWCVSRNDSSNMYYTYRFKEYEPAFYFVKVKDRTKKELGFFSMVGNVFNGQFKDKYHFFVVQVIKGAKMEDTTRKQYFVTSAMNDGDIDMSWNDIVRIEPRIANLQEIFKPVELKPEDKEFYDKYKYGTDDETFCKFDYTNKRRYLDIYVTQDKLLSDKEFECLPDDLKNLYIGFGVGLSEGQFELIKTNKNLLKRYQQITEKKVDEYLKGTRGISFKYTELLVLPEDKIKELTINLNFDDIYHLIKGQTIEQIYKILILLGDKGKKYILDLAKENMALSSLIEYNGLYTTKEYTNGLINVFLKIGGKDFINDLALPSFIILLKKSLEPEKIINLLGNKFKELISNINLTQIFKLLKYSYEPEKIFNFLPENKIKEFSSEIKANNYLITNLLQYKQEEEFIKIKKVLKKYVLDSTTPMNEIFKSLTSLQEELTEQRKQTIKETNLMKVQNFIKKKKSLLKENYNPNIIDEVFSETPELNQIGTKEDYNNYLNSVFNGESDLFYRGDVDGLEKFRYSESSSNKNRHKFGSGIYFTKNKPYAISYANDIPNGKLYKCLVDTSNKIEFNKQLDFISYVNKYLNMGNTIPSGVEIDIFTKEQQKKGKDIYIKNYNGHDELVVGDTNKILILGSNKDKEMFKNYMNNNQ